MKNLFLFLIFIIFPYTNQLLCLTNCHNVKRIKGELFQDPLMSPETNKCKQDRRLIRCYGRIMSYRNFSNRQRFISYSFGSQEHSIEKEMEQLANIKQLTFIIYFLFLFEPDEIKEMVVTAYILCQTHDNCALSYIKSLFNLYREQNDFYYDSDLLFDPYNSNPNLICYDYKTKQTIECIPTQYSRCIFHNINKYQQGCYSDLNKQLEYVFMITSNNNDNNNTSLKKLHQLIICDQNNCNQISIIKTLENLIYNYTFGTMFIINQSNQIKFHLIQMLKFFFMIFYMIF